MPVVKVNNPWGDVNSFRREYTLLADGCFLGNCWRQSDSKQWITLNTCISFKTATETLKDENWRVSDYGMATIGIDWNVPDTSSSESEVPNNTTIIDEKASTGKTKKGAKKKQKKIRVKTGLTDTDDDDDWDDWEEDNDNGENDDNNDDIDDNNTESKNEDSDESVDINITLQKQSIDMVYNDDSYEYGEDTYNMGNNNDDSYEYDSSDDNVTNSKIKKMKMDESYENHFANVDTSWGTNAKNTKSKINPLIKVSNSVQRVSNPIPKHRARLGRKVEPPKNSTKKKKQKSKSTQKSTKKKKKKNESSFKNTGVNLPSKPVSTQKQLQKRYLDNVTMERSKKKRRKMKGNTRK